MPRAKAETVTRIATPPEGRARSHPVLRATRRYVTSPMHLASVRESYRQLEEKTARLQEAYDRLKELDRLKSNFLATVSHELRTPLTSIIGYSEMLAEGIAGELKPEQQEFVKTIHEKGEQLLSLIMGLLDLGKLESGTMSDGRCAPCASRPCSPRSCRRSRRPPARRASTLETRWRARGWPSFAATRAPAAGVPQPRRERDQVHAGGRHGHASRALMVEDDGAEPGRRRARAARAHALRRRGARRGHGHRHPAERAGEGLRRRSTRSTRRARASTAARASGCRS